MKKNLFALTIFLSSIAITNSMAEDNKFGTRGHMLGLNLIESRLSFKTVATRSNYPEPRMYPDAKGNDFGFGFSYKYGIKPDMIVDESKISKKFLNNFFIAPGLFFEKPNVSANRSGVGSIYSDPNGQLVRLSVRSRYGASLDFGYDFSKYFSPYLTGGISRIDYTTSDYWQINSINYLRSQIRDTSTSDWFYGFGFRSKITNNFSLGFEYNTQNFRAKTTSSDYVRDFNSIYRAKLETYKIGAFYNF